MPKRYEAKIMELFYSSSEPKDPNSNTPNIPISIGEEFIAWASQYWRLREKYENERARYPSSRGAESCDSDFVMEAFSGKIDELIRTRMVNYGIIAD